MDRLSPERTGRAGSDDVDAQPTDPCAFLSALRAAEPVRAVELRPPPTNLPETKSVDLWIDLNRLVRNLLGEGRFVLFTDDAVGSREEESLQHLSANLGREADLSHVVPFLTCKHSVDYALLFAQRALSLGIQAITVTGGDENVGPPRSFPRSRDLRRFIRERVPRLRLGAWVNPFRDPVQQVDLLMDPAHHADYYVTQVVSHHRLDPVDRFLEEAARRGLATPGLVGVFFYRSASPKTLDRLAAFIPVPREDLVAEFASGETAESICARTLSSLRERGVEKTYLSNLDTRRASRRLRTIEAAIATNRELP